MGFREENGFTFDDVKPIAHGNVGSILLPASQVPDKYVLSDKLFQGETMTFSRFIEEIQGLQADRPQSLTLL